MLGNISLRVNQIDKAFKIWGEFHESRVLQDISVHLISKTNPKFNIRQWGYSLTKT